MGRVSVIKLMCCVCCSAEVPGAFSNSYLRSPRADARNSPLQQLICSPSFDRKVPVCYLSIEFFLDS